MARLSQVIALETDARTHAADARLAVDRQFLTPDRFEGFRKTYQRDDEEAGEQLPAEGKLVQLRVDDVLESFASELKSLFDVTLQRDEANCLAKATVEVDGKVLLKDVPVPYLLFMETQLRQLDELLKRAPKLAPDVDWEAAPEANTGLRRAAPVTTSRRVKRMRAFEKSPATDKFPAQVDTYTEDVPVGKWTSVQFSGALPQTRVQELRVKVRKLSTAVKQARELANLQEAPPREVGKALLAFVFSSE
jgi:hypothetical protein